MVDTDSIGVYFGIYGNDMLSTIINVNGLASFLSFSLLQHSSANLRFIIHINDARICVSVVVVYLGIVNHKISSYLLNVL
jgi:hypothetical protein